MDADISVSQQQVQTTVDQKLQNGTTVDSVDRWQSSSFIRYKAPHTFSFSVGNNEVLRGALKLISGQKYNNWNGLADVRNHHVFTVTSDMSQLTAGLVSTTSDNVIKTELIDAPSYAGNTVQFSDPWLRDTTDTCGKRNRGMSAPLKSRSSPFQPDSTTSFSGDVYQGVFLSQSDPTKPRYSVGVQNYPSTGDAWNNAQFLTWTSQVTSPISLTSPVVFANAADTVRARFKACGHSSTTAAFDNNSQQKVLNLPNYGLDPEPFIYESAGGSFLENVWTLKGLQLGVTVVGGIPSSTLINRSPSLFIDSAGTGFFKVWEQDTLAGMWRHKIMWDGQPSVDIFDLYTNSSSFDMMPVVGTTLQGNGLTSVALIVFRTTTGLYCEAAYFQHGTWHWTQDNQQIPGTDSASINPTIAGMTTTSGGTPMYVFHLVYEEPGQSGGLKYRTTAFTTSQPSAKNITWSCADSSDFQNSATLTHSKPTIVNVNGIFDLTWRQVNNSVYQGGVNFEKRDFHGWKSAGTFYTYLMCPGGQHYPSGPSISARNQADYTALVWSTSSDGVVAGVQWSSVPWGPPFIMDAQGTGVVADAMYLKGGES